MPGVGTPEGVGPDAPAPLNEPAECGGIRTVFTGEDVGADSDAIPKKDAPYDIMGLSYPVVLDFAPQSQLEADDD